MPRENIVIHRTIHKSV